MLIMVGNLILVQLLAFIGTYNLLFCFLYRARLKSSAPVQWTWYDVDSFSFLITCWVQCTETLNPSQFLSNIGYWKTWKGIYLNCLQRQISGENYNIDKYIGRNDMWFWCPITNVQRATPSLLIILTSKHLFYWLFSLLIIIFYMRWESLYS